MKNDEINEEPQDTYLEAFRLFDKDGDGSITSKVFIS